MILSPQLPINGLTQCQCRRICENLTVESILAVHTLWTNSADNWTNTAKMLEETTHYTDKIKKHNIDNRCEFEGYGKQNTTSDFNWNGDCKYWNCELYPLPPVSGEDEYWKFDVKTNQTATKTLKKSSKKLRMRITLYHVSATWSLLVQEHHKSADTLLETNRWIVFSNEIVRCRISSNITGSRREICKPPGKHSRGCWSRQTTTRLSCPATNYTWL